MAILATIEHIIDLSSHGAKIRFFWQFDEKETNNLPIYFKIPIFVGRIIVSGG